MAFGGRPSLLKRQKEQARRERQKEKAERRAQRNQERKDQPGAAVEEEDPDIAGIVPGPQPPRED
jgi:hypothetical protein